MGDPREQQQKSQGAVPKLAAGTAPTAPPLAVEAALHLTGGLNEPQARAVTHAEGPLLILAGPGSGKTRVITRRIAHLVSSIGVHPSQILAITFTNKAAREMRERVQQLIPDEGLWISTFHSTCARILRREIEVLPGYTRDFSIYDTHDRNQLLKELIKKAGFDLARFRPSLVGSWISELKNRKYGREQGLELGGLGDGMGIEGIEDEVTARIRRSYEEAMRANNALDFDDLLLKVLEIFETRPGVRDAYSRRFRYVMVDEYQDTNRVQYLLTRHLASHHGNLTVCGDPDQSIYAWRGADIRNILAFESDFPGPEVIRLEQNYRSVGRVLQAAQAVISNNSSRKEKELWTEREEGQKLVCLRCSDENDEAREIVSQVRSLQLEGYDLNQVAVFYRVNFMQRALEAAFRLAGMPYQIVAGLEFYQRREIRDLISFLKLIVNPADDVAFRRVVNVPQRGIGAKGLEALASWAADRRLSLFEAAQSEEALASIRGRARKGLAAFAGLLRNLEEQRGASASEAVERLLAEIDYEAWIAQMQDESGVDREANVDEFRTFAEQFEAKRAETPGLADKDDGQRPGGLRSFLEEIALVSDADSYEETAKKVTLMTLHAAKGLEFPVVFIAGLEDELLPHARALFGSEGEGDEGLEEERRLFYVGITRAQDRLFLTQTVVRFHFGQESYRRPSRFLEEIPSELIEGLETDADEEEMLGAYEPSQELPRLRVGDRVEHEHFGRGTIELLQGSGINARATVHFPVHGQKQLLLQYAKLKVINQ